MISCALLFVGVGISGVISFLSIFGRGVMSALQRVEIDEPMNLIVLLVGPRRPQTAQQKRRFQPFAASQAH